MSFRLIALQVLMICNFLYCWLENPNLWDDVFLDESLELLKTEGGLVVRTDPSFTWLLSLELFVNVPGVDIWLMKGFLNFGLKFLLDLQLCRTFFLAFNLFSALFQTGVWNFSFGLGDLDKDGLGRLSSGKWANTRGWICEYWLIGEPHLLIKLHSGDPVFLLTKVLSPQVLFSLLPSFFSMLRCSLTKALRLLSTCSFNLSSSSFCLFKLSISSISS